LVAFTGRCIAQCDVHIERVFEVATDPALLERWTIGEFENIRLMQAASFGAGIRFRADDFLAEGVKDMDHVYQIVRYEPPSAFAWRCIDGPEYAAELGLTEQDGGTQIDWSHTAAPSILIDRIMGVLMRSRITRDTQSQAEREVEKLIALARNAD
jgi:uncharacterized protein YndB with AHSA1/START domain